MIELAISVGTAKPMPTLPPERLMMAELMPISSPFMLTSAPPELPGIDRCVGLNEIFVAVAADAGATQRADDARRDRMTEAERVADRDDEIADARAFRVADRHFGQIPLPRP